MFQTTYLIVDFSRLFLRFPYVQIAVEENQHWSFTEASNLQKTDISHFYLPCLKVIETVTKSRF